MNPTLTHQNTNKSHLTSAYSAGFILLIMAALTSLPATASSNAFYVGLSYTNNDIAIKSPASDESASSDSAGVMLAYRFTDWMAVELAYHPSSDTEVSFNDDTHSYQANYEFTTSLSFLAQYNFTGSARNWAVLGKLGVMQGKSKASTSDITDTYWLKNGERLEGGPLTQEDIDDWDFDDQQAVIEAMIDAFAGAEQVVVSSHDSDSASETVPVISTGFRYTCKRESFPLCPEWLIDQLGFSFEVSYFKLEPELLGEKHDIEVIQPSLGLQWYFY